MSSANWVYYSARTNPLFPKELLKIHFILVSYGNDAEGDFTTITCICICPGTFATPCPVPLSSDTGATRSDKIGFFITLVKIGNCGEDKKCVSVATEG